MASEQTTDKKDPEETSFTDLGIIKPLSDACAQLNFKHPTEIQCESIPWALEGRDIIGLAQTGSGKTAAFALPILQALWEAPQGLFACVMAPTRELAFQISETFEALGALIGVRCAVIVGGMDMMSQSIALSKKPHILVCTPGRLADHLENTKGFSLRNLKYLVMDEADRLLDMDFGPKIDQILKVIPKERHTYLFSATMTTKVQKLQRASLNNPVKVEVSTKYSTVSTLLQHYLFFPLKHKDCYLVYLLNELAGHSTIIFTRTVNDTQKIAIILRNLGFPAIPLHGQLAQSKRLGALNKFKSGARNILVATDVASRGLDIPMVDVVINYDVPTTSKDYIHRVGRTARAGRSGKSCTFVTQYDVELIQRIEKDLNRTLDPYPLEKEDVLLLQERVSEAQRLAVHEMKELAAAGKEGKSKRMRSEGNDDDRDRDDDVVQAGGGKFGGKAGANKKSGGKGKSSKRGRF
ncbi:P-loop containing nucleoside triphosphate hydrolase protein [Jimgerdemannia flammicorona]|uniref:ATP-dependent rRNA helicase RRP3 n=1 Tax=Jimgerdemannia flammicorona TaxID=994334 RepID=A0A433QSH4_9FUNG|nr:P-loop containing nucleoside triphosphate hydrolase protein [Jimgerdemannia flammicorona]